MRTVPGGASAEAIEFHYGVSNQFYALWLDPRMVYSCALWGPDADRDTLETAQLRKLRYLSAQANLPSGARVLDVGCGWGAMLEHLREERRAEQTVGLTLSSAQADFIQARTKAGVAVRLEDWRHHDRSHPYDGVICVGALEHFARPGLSRVERVGVYRDFFRACRSWLRPGRRLVIQTITKGDNVRISRATAREMGFIMARIFPQSELPWLSEIIEASERRFALAALRCDAPDYVLTAAAWLARLDGHAEEAAALIGTERVAEYQRYLSSFGQQFAEGHVNLVRLTFTRA